MQPKTYELGSAILGAMTEPASQTLGRLVELPERNVTLCVARAGSSDATTQRPLVVLNGTGSDLRNAPNALAWPIAEHFDVLTYDHRCLGRSVQEPDDYQPTMADFALDALALCDAEGIGEFDVIGVSFGGMVAQEVAIAAPDRVQSLVLCCTSSGGAGGASYPLHEMYASGKNRLDVLDVWDTRTATDHVLAEQMRAGSRSSPAEPPAGLLRQIEARRTHDTWDRLGQITADTLIAYGEHDGVAPPKNSLALASRIPHAETAAFDGGHPFLSQDRTAFAAIQVIIAFAAMKRIASISAKQTIMSGAAVNRVIPAGASNFVMATHAEHQVHTQNNHACEIPDLSVIITGDR